MRTNVNRPSYCTFGSMRIQRCGHARATPAPDVRRPAPSSAMRSRRGEAAAVIVPIGSQGSMRGRRLFLLRQFLILQRHPRREQLWAALSEQLFHLRVRRSQHLARDGGGGHDRLHQMADVGKVLDRGVGVAVALEHDRLALILVEKISYWSVPVSLVRTISIASFDRRF